jgi:adenine deaminase
MWTHLRLAASTGKMNAAELFHAVTAGPAAVWGMKSSGNLSAGWQADLVVASPPNGEFLSVQPKDILMVMRAGQVVLYDQRIAESLPASVVNVAAYAPVQLGGAIKYCIGNLPQLIRDILNCYPAAQLPVATCAN